MMSWLWPNVVLRIECDLISYSPVVALGSIRHRRLPQYRGLVTGYSPATDQSELVANVVDKADKFTCVLSRLRRKGRGWWLSGDDSSKEPMQDVVEPEGNVK